MEALEKLIFTDPVKLDLEAVMLLSGRMSDSLKREIIEDLAMLPGPVDSLRVIVENKETEAISPLTISPLQRQIEEEEDDFGVEQGIIEGGDGSAADFGSLSTQVMGSSYLVESDGAPDAINEEMMQEIPGAIAAAAILARHKKMGERMKRELEERYDETEFEYDEDEPAITKGRKVGRSRTKTLNDVDPREQQA